MDKITQQNLSVKKGNCQLHLTRSRDIFLQLTRSRQIVILFCALLLILAPLGICVQRTKAQATRASCYWYHIASGDTLGNISHYYHVNIWTIARANSVRNINLIYTGQHLCIPHAAQRATSGLLSNGKVRWYAYNALEWSNRQQANKLIRRAASRHGLSANLMLAIAWQESGWTQHVIARDGGIGVMQLMPYTTQSLNQQVHGHYDPYKLSDNIELGAIYLKSLSHGFHGNLSRIISAYNEGGWNVQHRGIFNWPYVRNVRALMYRY
jgi:hypothetical protein